MTVQAIDGSISTKEFSARMLLHAPDQQFFSISHAVPENMFVAAESGTEEVAYGSISFMFPDAEIYSIYAPAEDMRHMSHVFWDCAETCTDRGFVHIDFAKTCTLHFTRTGLAQAQNHIQEAEYWLQCSNRFIKAASAFHEAAQVIDYWTKGVTFLTTIR